MLEYEIQSLMYMKYTFILGVIGAILLFATLLMTIFLAWYPNSDYKQRRDVKEKVLKIICFSLKKCVKYVRHCGWGGSHFIILPKEETENSVLLYLKSISCLTLRLDVSNGPIYCFDLKSDDFKKEIEKLCEKIQYIIYHIRII